MLLPSCLTASLCGLLTPLAMAAGDPGRSEEAGAAAADAEPTTQGDEEWSYHGATGPAQWASLSPEYASCGGDRQSPVDIAGVEPDDTLQALQASYAPTAIQVDTDAHVTHLDVEEAGGLTFQGQRYALVQFHFHTPSEHTIEGASFPAEAHLVHESDTGEMAVIGIMIEEGAEHSVLRQVLSGSGAQVDPGQLLPEDKGYYTYTGSLTTPPCTEGVRWIIMQQPVELSSTQIEQLKGDQTNRPVQPLNGRRILASQ